jgi:uncharacterized protein (TIGR02300 family)
LKDLPEDIMPQATVADPRGLKRICMSCSTRFYDLNKRPIACPNCDVEFTGEVKIKARRGRLASNDVAEDGATGSTEAEDTAEEGETEEIESDEETVSLDEVETDEEGGDEDLDIDGDLDEDNLDDDDDLDDDADIDVDLDDEK